MIPQYQSFPAINYNYKQDRAMFDSNYPSNKKRGTYFEDTTYLPTAERSHFLDRTPTRPEEYLSPSKRTHHRLSEARRSIDEAIEHVSAKRSLNQEAVEQVRSLNREIASSLSSCNPAKALPFAYDPRNRTADRTRDDYSREQVATSHFEWGQQEELKRSQQDSVLSNENVNLRSRLNEEIRKNNELIRYVKTLEGENATLRNSHIAPPAPADLGNVLEENRHLRNQLQNGASMPIDVLEELRRLKEENQLLRRDTIALLKKTSS